MTKRVTAYAMLAHHALNELWLDKEGCCPKCCTPCGALQLLDGEGILDTLVQEWYEYDNGIKVFRDDTTPWFVAGKVDRGWLYSQWSLGQVHCGDDHNAE